jgi:2-keto-3-deoxy-L-rhamnonate aldolase RhmA
MKQNKIRELLVAGKPTIGTHLFLTDPLVVEMVGHSRAFDYVEFLAEYSAYGLVALDNFCRAAELHGLGTMIKVDQENHRFVAQRAVGSGFDSVLFADSHCCSDVEDCVRSVRADAPSVVRGLYGAAARRNALPDYDGSGRFVQKLDEVVVAIMVEKHSALEELDAILETPGVDMVQWGPNDYAMSIGAAGESGKSDRIRKVERQVIAQCLAAGVPFRGECENLEDARYYADQGVRHFCFGWDLWMLHQQWKRDGEDLRDLLGEIVD